ncbi:hypothetical protein J7M22_15300 [Candidatus Poribacteria bacterium]|nr:hypothetical protein [Candidatus Poribacteria bacterium]
MEKGLGSVLGIVAVDPSGNLPIIWGDIKTASVTRVGIGMRERGKHGLM